MPAVYGRIFPELAASDAPQESDATCDDCAMCARGEERAGDVYFAADAKCCTYHPSLPNYLVGALLADSDPALDDGRRRIRARIAKRVGVTPHAIRPPREDAAVYDALAPDLFGRARSLRCPYFDADRSNCTIWPFREATCSAYHCKFVHGADGEAYWQALKALLADVQQDLSMFAMRSLGFTPRQSLNAVQPRAMAEEVDGEPTPDAVHRTRFGTWTGREEAFYVACFDAVRNLSPEQARGICGVRATLRADHLAARLESIRSPALPEPLLRNPRLLQRRDARGHVVVGYSNLQPVRLRSEVLQALDDFDGRTPTREVQAQLAQRHGFTLSAGLLLRLYRFRILVAAHDG